MNAHEYAEVFRLLTNDELVAMAADIKEKGLLNPIITHQGKILDGRNRYAACKIAGVEPRFEEYTGADLLGAVVSLNEIRRHETPSQRSMAAARLAKLKNGTNRHILASPIGGATSETKTRDEAAELLKVGTSSLDRAKQIINKGVPLLADMVDSGEVSVDAARLVARLSEVEQNKAVSGGAAGVKEAAKKSRIESKSISDSLGSAASQSNDSESLKPDTYSRPQRVPGYVPSEGNLIWVMAKSQLVRIAKNDTERVEALTACIAYCQERITNNK